MGSMDCMGQHHPCDRFRVAVLQSDSRARSLSCGTSRFTTLNVVAEHAWKSSAVHVQHAATLDDTASARLRRLACAQSVPMSHETLHVA